MCSREFSVSLTLTDWRGGSPVQNESVETRMERGFRAYAPIVKQK
jgi:hypothetical protein